jgi:NADH-quinone oxidoreductase subunit L
MPSTLETLCVVCVLVALLLPLASFALSLLTSERYSWLISINSSLLILAGTIFSIILLASVWNNGPHELEVKWFSFGSRLIGASLLLSNETVLMLVVVSLVSFLVHLYSIGYMAADANVKKYFAMLGFFTFSMLGIVLADDLLLLFVFWELVGFSSYMLIGHWNEKPAAANAAKKAFIMNRIGDVGFLVGLMIIWSQTGSLNLSDVVATGSPGEWNTAASLCIFCGVVGKSAQFPLFTWLPDAMEGPTPVSALIHAATMVAAGVYLLIRTAPLFTEVSLIVVGITGLVTAVLAALSALYQNDIKRILAYSTISHLGLMLMAVGLGSPKAAFLHLYTHAFFKACLFLGAGSVIHMVRFALRRTHVSFDAQDIRNLGGLKRALPVTYVCMLVSAASLAGVPFFSGSLSKDAMLGAAWGPGDFFHWVMLIGLIVAFFLSTLYIFRLIATIFWGEQRKTQVLEIIRSPVVMRVPMVILAFLSLWFVVSWNPVDPHGWIYPESAPTSFWVPVISIVVVLVAMLTGYRMFKSRRETRNSLFENGYYVDRIYQKTFVRITHSFSNVPDYIDRFILDKLIHGTAYAQVTIAHVSGWFDRAVIDGFVNGVASLARTVGGVTRSFQRGNIQLYIFWSLFAIIIFLIWTIN